MAVVATGLTSGSDPGAGASDTTASVTLTSGRLILIGIYCRKSGAGYGDVASVTSTGATWEQVATITLDVSGHRRISIWRTMVGSNQTGAITINWSNSPVQTAWAVVDFAGVLTTGSNGSGALVQSATTEADHATSLTVTLAPFANANNAAFGWFGNGGVSGSYTPGSGFTELYDFTNAGASPSQLEAEWKATQDTTVDASWGSSGTAAGIAVEIAQTSGVTHSQTLAATTTVTPTLSRTVSKLLTVAVTMTPLMKKAIAKALAVVGSFAGGMAAESENAPGSSTVSLGVNVPMTTGMTTTRSGKHGGHQIRNEPKVNHRIRTKRG